MNKYNFSNSGDRSHLKSDKIFHLGVVVSNYDENDGGRLKVRLKGVDDHIEDKELPYVFPLLQKFLHIVPKNGESVWVMFPDKKNPHMDRLFIGPIISQPQKLNKDPHVITSSSALDSNFVSLQTNSKLIAENRGVFPKNDDIALQGRDNNDILLKDHEIQIRVGKYDDKVDDIPLFNMENPTYIQLKHNKINQKDGGYVNIVGSKVNILSHEGGSPRFKLGDQDDMISDAEMSKILNKAHPLVFGDLLIEYLNLFKEAFINHIHPYAGMKPEDLKGVVNQQKFLEYDVKKIISKNIKIN